MMLLRVDKHRVEGIVRFLVLSLWVRSVGESGQQPSIVGLDFAGMSGIGWYEVPNITLIWILYSWPPRSK